MVDHTPATARGNERGKGDEQKRQIQGLAQEETPPRKQGAPGTFSPQNTSQKSTRTLEKCENLQLRSEIVLLRSKQQQNRPNPLLYANIACLCTALP
ncbi:Hypothetical protein FKW44_000613 [Caligus rogercresseyi]|uniref:Uncharacterized protein n=1 Tax=Caligus rogercresseyi TaxID=217165 RepID=A0A7T8KHJ7_CALRO|nr:Hypothetical protein FKW44_000613 [Caligus rogercresseyi]